MILSSSVTKPELTGKTVVKNFSQLVHRPLPASDPARSTAFEILDEQYEVLDTGAFWDDTAEVLDPAAATAG